LPDFKLAPIAVQNESRSAKAPGIRPNHNVITSSNVFYNDPMGIQSDRVPRTRTEFPVDIAKVASR